MKAQSDAVVQLPDVSLEDTVISKQNLASPEKSQHLHSQPDDSQEDVEVFNGVGNGEALATVRQSKLDVGEVVTERSEDLTNAEDKQQEEEEDGDYELQQAHKIFQIFLLEKHKCITALFMDPIRADGVGSIPPTTMCLRKMEEKFTNREYQGITDFVADFRLLLENCYREYGVDHWISRQAQKMEVLLEQKLTLLSRILREKTSLTVTSKGRFGIEDDKGPGTSTRRRSIPRNLAAVTLGGNETLLVQALRMEEQLKAKEEKRLREQEKKEAEEASAKEMEEWDRSLLAKATYWPMETLWELPAIGHFLCLAQSVLNLPEIIFFELERCLLMPRCNSFLAKIMTSLLCHPQRRATLHRRPPLTYRRWEATLRHKVFTWYQQVGQSEDTGVSSERLGLCSQFFRTLGDVSPLEEKPFHQLPFNKRVWLLKGLCDFVYETQREVQDAVLGQPIHECRESILGYDVRDNAYIHFPHFCGADLRIYRQSPCMPPQFPPAPIRIRRLEPIKKSKASAASERRRKIDASSCKEKEGCFVGKEINLSGMIEDLTQEKSALMVKSEADTLLLCKEVTDSQESNGGKVDCMELERKMTTKKVLPCLSVGSNDPCPLDMYMEQMFEGKPEVKCSQSPVEDRIHENSCESKVMNEKSQESRCSFTNACASGLSSLMPSILENRIEGTAACMRTKKKKRKKKKLKDLPTKERKKKTVLFQRTATDKEGKKKKQRLGKIGMKYEAKNLTSKKRKIGPKFQNEPKFQLVCTNLDELRQLISRTEDDLQELGGNRKKSGKWYYRRQAVKELHITLIRLLNELLPWESKLVKAFQRNRARLKKEYNDFEKHPDYNNFVREEWMEEDGQGSAGREAHFPDTRSTDKTEKRDQGAKKGTSKADDSRQPMLETSGRSRTPRREFIAFDEHKTSPRSSKQGLDGNAFDESSPRKKIKTFDEHDLPVMQTEPKALEIQEDNLCTETSQGSTPLGAVLHKGSKPIQALLAKSVGNKVTLISQPTATKDVLMTVDAALQTSKLLTSPGHAPQPVFTPKTPLQIIYKIPEALDLLMKGNSPVKIGLHSEFDQKTGERTIQQVAVVPNLENRSQQNTTLVSSSNTSVQFSAVSDISKVEDSGIIPIQQVAHLTDTPGKSFSASKALSPTAFHSGAGMSFPKTSLTPIVSTTTSVSPPFPSKLSDPKQELKTVCIRDSQSILVTTRGGNTGVVKVQTSDQTVPSSIAPGPMITISPHFQAFLISKSPMNSTSAKGPNTSSTVPQASSQLTSLTQTPHTVPHTVSSGLKSSTISNDTLNKMSSTVSVPVASKINQCSRSSALPAIPHSNPNFLSNTVKDNLLMTHISPHPYDSKKMQSDEKGQEKNPLQRLILVSPSNIASPAIATKVPSPSSSSPTQRLMLISQSPPSVGQPLLNLHKHTKSSDAMTVSLSSAPQITDLKVGTNVSQTVEALPNNQAIGVLPCLPTRLPTEPLNHMKQVSIPVAGSAFKSSTVSAESPAVPASGGKTLMFSLGQLLTSKVSPVSQAQVVSLSVPSLPSVCKTNCESEGRPLTAMWNSSMKSLVKDSHVTTAATIGMSPTGLVHGKPQLQDPSKSASLKSSPYKPTPSSNNSTIPTQILAIRRMDSAQHPAPHYQTEPITPLQQKIMINTPTPLSPGSHIVINNTRFVVPAQGLGPGSHMLLISSPVVSQSVQQGINPSPTPQKTAIRHGTPTSIVSPASGTSKASSSMPSIPVLYKPSAPLDVKLVSSFPSRTPTPVTPIGTMIRAPLSTGSATAASQISQLYSVASTVHLNLNPVVTSTGINTQGKNQTALVSQPPVGGLQGSTAIAPVGSIDVLPKVQLTTVVPLAGAINSRTQVLPSATAPPICSTFASVQCMPGASGLPIGCGVAGEQSAPPNFTVPSSNSTVIIASGHPVRTMRPESFTIPLGLNSPLQISTPALLTSSSNGKLLVSPDGAVLNAVRSSSLSSLPVMSRTMSTVTVTSSSDTEKRALPSLKIDDLVSPSPSEKEGH